MNDKESVQDANCMIEYDLDNLSKTSLISSMRRKEVGVEDKYSMINRAKMAARLRNSKIKRRI